MNKIENIVIVGGGTAGWMSATTLISLFPNKKITLVGSPNIKTVGVGESTVGNINNWMQLVGIEGDEFMPHADSTYKLSIGFEDFYRKGSGRFHYPFGGVNMEGNRAGLNDWYFKKILYPETPLSDYAECMFPSMALVTENKISKNKEGALPDFDFLRSTAYQFDAVKFGLWLKEHYCLPRGVNHILAEVKEAPLGSDGIEHLVLDDGRKISADLFIDCTGFSALLIDKTLKEPFESYEHILPNNSAWATKIPYEDKEKELVNYTNCTAIANGWVWNIPLWSRMGCGYVYSNRFISDEEALDEFKQHLKEKGYKNVEDLEYEHIPMRVGTHTRTWVKNVCAIGLSGGFMEPLESLGLNTTMSFLYLLVRTLQRDRVSQWDRDVFNAACKSRYKGSAEFIALHYALSHRDDSEYWREISTREFAPALMKEGVEPRPSTNQFMTAVYDKMEMHEFRPTEGFHCIATGMNWFPTDMPAVVYSNCNNNIDIKNEFESFVRRLGQKKNHWRQIVKDWPSHYQFLKENFNYHE